MKISRILPQALAASLFALPALAQGSGKNVTILHMSGPQLGVRIEEVDGDAVTRLRLKEEKGALVTEVLKDSAAEKAGIHKDDVIVRFQGESILTAAQLSRLVRDVPDGRKVDIDVVRNGAPVKVTATIKDGDWSSEGANAFEFDDLTDRLNEKFETMKAPKLKLKSPNMKVMPRAFKFDGDEDGMAWANFGVAGRGRLGITYTEIEGQLAHFFKAPKDTAVLINSVAEGSPAEKAGLKAGDLLTMVDGESIEDSSDLHDAVAELEPGKPAQVAVWRDGRSVEMKVTLDEPRKKSDTLRWKKPVS